jgi:hypothetical protein
MIGRATLPNFYWSNFNKTFCGNRTAIQSKAAGRIHGLVQRLEHSCQRGIWNTVSETQNGMVLVTDGVSLERLGETYEIRERPSSGTMRKSLHR